MAATALFPNGIEAYLVGGILVGVGIAFVFLTTGKVAGASTLYTAVWSYLLSGSFFRSPTFVESRGWRILLALGTILGGLLFVWWFADGIPVVSSVSPLLLFVGGILVGIGTRMANGCPSGHAICGNATANKDSLVATIVFLLTGIVVATITKSIL